MHVPDGAPVDDLILNHLAEADLPEPASDLIFAALDGEEQLEAVLGGDAVTQKPQPGSTQVGDSGPVGTYLASIEVAGFRGIGPAATLSLKPGPGLTIVTGRNGSGKSSFAEAAELALTGDNKRWAGRSSIWQEGWRNLHSAEDARIRVRLGVEGHHNGATVECHWTPGSGLTDCTSFLQLAGQPRQPVAELGWAQALELYRPFLSYAELGGLLGGRPSEMHDSLQRILGLGRLVEVETLLKGARRQLDERRKLAAARLPELRAALAAHPDARARRAEAALAGKAADIEALLALATVDEPAEEASVLPLRQLDVLALPERERVVAEVERLRGALRQIEELSGTPAEEARALAGLLQDALRHQRGHPDQPCPVCGGRTLDSAWVQRAEREVQQLTELGDQLDGSHRVRRAAPAMLRSLVPGLPVPLTLDLRAEGVATEDARLAWRRWDALLGSADAQQIAEQALTTFDALVAALRPVQEAARAVLQRRQQAWQPVADQIRDWVEVERAGRRANAMFVAARKAVDWLRGVGEEIRNDKLAPVASAATRVWNTLRQESDVQLGAIRLLGTGTTRRVELPVEVDGVPGAALGVMSQGELHSLALALFLPRATMPASPFRFLIIDDPVQSMDPAKVYGLATVLADVARQRQVIVFTHDDRLPAAVRHLQLEARILTVSRQERSQVTVSGDGHSDPARRYLDDARAITLDDRMAHEVKVPIVCTLIRDALEFSCQEVVWARGFRTGQPIAEIEAELSEVQGLRQHLALALLGEAKRLDDLTSALSRVHPGTARLVADVNRGAHGGSASTGVGDLVRLVDDARRVVERLVRS